jgi:hypothetical protein
MSVMYYHYGIILVFYPLINLRFLDSKISAVEVYVVAADAVATLIPAHEILHRLRRTPCILPYIILASGIAHLGVANSRTALLATLYAEFPILQVMFLSHGTSERTSRILLSCIQCPT